MINIRTCKIINENPIIIGVVPISKLEYIELANDYNEYYSGKLTLGKFEKKNGFDLYSMLSFGNPKEGSNGNKLKSSDVDTFIENTSIKTSDGKNFKSYRCFCGEHFDLDYKKEVLHPSALSAWNCLIQNIGNPDYIIVFNYTELIRNGTIKKEELQSI